MIYYASLTRWIIFCCQGCGYGYGYAVAVAVAVAMSFIIHTSNFKKIFGSLLFKHESIIFLPDEWMFLCASWDEIYFIAFPMGWTNLATLDIPWSWKCVPKLEFNLESNILTWLKNFSLKAAKNSWRILFELRVQYNNSNREAQFGAKWAYLEFK